MDHLFGSVGAAQREKERWDEVYHEVGLTELLERSGLIGRVAHSGASIEKEPPTYKDALEKERPRIKLRRLSIMVAF